ncbi:hypothetical protein [Streptomyces sp. NPDC086182]|jgi:hypothetical protein|uniref:hypothetical protein n=1 Tax=Streptomyces sp. NPDC086182 TaxID=3155058 RepID=UPI00342A9CC0
MQSAASSHWRPEWNILHRIVRGAPEANPASPHDRLLPPVLLALVEQSPTWGIYLSDHRWDVLAYNSPVQEYFPRVAKGLNIAE